MCLVNLTTILAKLELETQKEHTSALLMEIQYFLGIAHHFEFLFFSNHTDSVNNPRLEALALIQETETEEYEEYEQEENSQI